jgi:hypothetical protein
VTRAANTFGRTHQDKIEQAYAGVARIVAGGQRAGIFRAGVDPTLAGQAFFGLVEQVLTAWIFAGLPVPPAELERAKQGVVDIICSGLDA